MILLGLETLAALKRRANTGLFNWPDTTLATGQEVDLEGLALSMSGRISSLSFKVALDSLLGAAEVAGSQRRSSGCHTLGSAEPLAALQPPSRYL